MRKHKVSRKWEITRRDFEEEVIGLVPEAEGTQRTSTRPLGGLVKTMEDGEGISFTNVPGPDPAWRLDVGTLTRVSVESINYQVVEARVRIIDDKPVPI
jgi:hypothetical protein